ncbi:MAG: chemotaxis protein CheA [Planctomycetota bacterium]|jgi:two-component system chemotaxis sensor kinase CheA
MEETAVKYDVDPELLTNFLDESEESIATLDSLFVELEQHPKDKEIIGSIFRVAHSIKGLAAFLSLKAIKDLTHNLENVLDNLRNDTLCVNSTIIDCLLSGFDEVSNMLTRVRACKSQVEDEKRLQKLLNEIKGLSDSNIHGDKRDISKVLDDVTSSLEQISDQVEELENPQDKIPEDAVQAEKDKGREVTTTTTGRTMRVSEEQIDVFMHYVGDLIEISESFNLFQKRIDINSDTQLAGEFKDVNSGFNQLSDKLQKSLLAIRKVPARNLIQKVPRMVRDLANSLCKEVKVEVTGQDVQIDKSMIEALESPINHLVRNCVDHGIENPEERKQAGKTETGIVRIDIAESEEDVIIKIEDDGSGIDPEKIRTKAIHMGLVNEDQAAQLNDRDVFQFIFSSGFSTANKISDVSGRGVGMDVVRTNVESLKGSIDSQSTLGQGSTVTLRLPSSLTVLVVNGMLADVGDQQYIIKVEDIYEIIRPKPQEITTVNGTAECLHAHGQLYPLIRLHELFGVTTEVTNPADAIVILAKNKDCHGAILVDKILGQQRVVVKELDTQFSYLNMVAGTAILANTKVGLVLDIPRILAESMGGRVIE